MRRANSSPKAALPSFQVISDAAALSKSINFFGDFFLTIRLVPVRSLYSRLSKFLAAGGQAPKRDFRAVPRYQVWVCQDGEQLLAYLKGLFNLEPATTDTEVVAYVTLGNPFDFPITNSSDPKQIAWFVSYIEVKIKV